MKIDKGANIAVVINRHWANLHGVRIFLRHYDDPEREIRGVDESHIVLARALDSEDPQGLWIELDAHRQKQDPTIEKYSFFIPWSQVITVVVAETFSPAIRDEIRRIGFSAEADPG